MNCNKSSFPCSSNIYFLSITVVLKVTVPQQSCQEAPKACLSSEHVWKADIPAWLQELIGQTRHILEV